LDPKTAFITSQVVHISCKIDHREILAGPASKKISAANEKLFSSASVFIKAPNEEKVRSVYLSKHAKGMAIDNGLLNTYTISTTDNANGGFSIKHSIEEKHSCGSAILLIAQSFDLFVTGDMSYCANVLVMPASTSYLCPFCLLSRPEWGVSTEMHYPCLTPQNFVPTLLHLENGMVHQI
jgi:hypothetical protein